MAANRLRVQLFAFFIDTLEPSACFTRRSCIDKIHRYVIDYSIRSGSYAK